MLDFFEGRQELDRCGFKWYLHPIDLIDIAIARDGIWEPKTTVQFNAIVKPGMTLVDVGANIGYFTLRGSRLVGPTGSVIAIDPSMRAFALMSYHVALNGCGNVTALRAALGAAPLRRDNDMAFSWTVTGAKRCDETASVRQVTLDTVVDAIGVGVDVIKVDVDGWDLRVMLGARESVMKHRPILIVEVCDWALDRIEGKPSNGDNVRRLLSLIADDYQYRIFSEHNMGKEITVAEAIHFVQSTKLSFNAFCFPKAVS